MPPPPPGSAARKALEEAIVDAKDSGTELPVQAPPEPPSRRPATMPPPLPPRAKAPTAQVPALPDPVIPLDRPKVPPTSPPPPRSKSPTSNPPVNVFPPARAASPSSSPPIHVFPPADAPPRVNDPVGTAPGAVPKGTPRPTQPPLPAIPPLVISGGMPKDATVVDTSPPPLHDDTQRDRAEPATDVVNALPPVSGSVDDGRLVPVGEFDDGRGIDDGKRRAMQAQLTFKRDAAEALLKMPPPPPPAPPPRPKPVVEERGDPTAVDPDFAQNEASAARRGKIRAAAKLRRKRGLFGDVTYVFTALFGVRRSRRELADLEIRQDTRRQSRRRHLITLGRTAALAAFEHAALSEASEALIAAEEERSQHAGQVAAADAEIDRVKRDRDTNAKRAYAERVAIDNELGELAKKLEPLERDAAVVQKRADALRDALARVDRQIAATEASTVSLKNPKTDLAAVKAEVATLRADRKAVERDEPAIAAELDALEPRIAALEAAQHDAEARRYKIGVEEEEDKRRTEELLAAIASKRKVVDRATAEAETARDTILLDLGERLYNDRPTRLAAQLAPIDEIDLELGVSERRADELREILSNVDRAKVARGALMITLVVLALGGVAAAIVYQTL